MEERDNVKLIIDVHVNGFPYKKHIDYHENKNNSIEKYLEEKKYPNSSIAALYNNRENLLDVIKGRDEYSIVSGITRLISCYPYDLTDTSLYAITESSYATMMLRLIGYKIKLLEFVSKKENSFGLVKKNRK